MTKGPVLFVYATKENREFVENLAQKNNIKVSYIINQILQAYREGVDIEFKKKPLSYYQKKKAGLIETNIEKKPKATKVKKVVPTETKTKKTKKRATPDVIAHDF